MRATYPETSGDPVLRVVVHRGRPEWRMVTETVLAPLQHFGMPYRTVDLARQSLADEPLDGAAGVVLGQEGLGPTLRPADLGALADAVARGIGLVGLDAKLRDYPEAWCNFLGLAPAGPEIPCVLLRIADTGHMITERRRQDEEVPLKLPAPVQSVGAADVAWRTLLDTGRAPEIGAWGERRPALVARTRGAGRIAHFLVSVGVWLRQHIGHGNGLTDLLWRSIVWTARRPFVMQAMPPYVTTRLDNVTGRRDRFTYLETFNRHGYVAVVGLYTREVRNEDVPALRSKSDQGWAECSAHTLDEDCRNLVFGRFDLQDLSEDELVVRFEEVDQAFKRWGIPQAKVVNAHWGVVGTAAVPFLRARSQRFLMKPLRFGRAMYGDLETVNEGWRPRPFGNYDLVMDAMPAFPDFYVASVQLPRSEGIDFLQACPSCGGPDPIADVEHAAQKGARMLRRGLENLFFGCLLTHEGRVYGLPDGHLDRILGRIDELLEGWPRFHRGYDHIAQYAWSRDASYIRSVERDGRDSLILSLAGESAVEQYLYVFADSAERLRHGYCPVPHFRGGATIVCDPASPREAPGRAGPRGLTGRMPE